MASITVEDQITAMQRAQGLLDDDNAANRIGPSIPRAQPTPNFPSTAKTIQKPPQLSTLTAKPMVTITAPPQRTIVSAPIMQRPPPIQPVTIITPPTHTVMTMPPVITVPQPTTVIHPPPGMEEPPSKRSKTEDQLIPEEEFYKSYGRVRFDDFFLKTNT